MNDKRLPYDREPNKGRECPGAFETGPGKRITGMTSLVHYDRARTALIKATEIDDVMEIRGQAAALKAYASQINDNAMEISLAEIKIRAERRAGEILRDMQKHKGGPAYGNRNAAKTTTNERSAVVLFPETDVVKPKTLAELQISLAQSSKWQKSASLPVEAFEKEIEEAKASGRPITSTAINRQVQRHVNRQQTATSRTTGAAQGLARVIYADPPWPYSNSGPANEADSYNRAERHYATMSIADICDFTDDTGRPVKDMAQDDAVLFLWVTSPFYLQCQPVIDAWGFTYKTGMVWDKQRPNFGYYVSVQHEHVLICTKGSCTPDRHSPMISSVQRIKKSRVHSEKPAEFRTIIERLYDGPYLELFGRAQAPGWTVLGNQVDAYRGAA